MNTRFLKFLPLLLVLSELAFGQIEIRLSIKVIVDPASGARPVGITDDLLRAAERNANAWMDGYWRGYRFRITEIVNIGGPLQGGLAGPSKWYRRDVRGTNWADFQSDTRGDRYVLRSDQVNYYITDGPVGPGNSGGACPIADNPSDSGYFACFSYSDDGPWWLVHETGHFFGLYHTFGGAQCPTATSPGDDGITDTLPDIDCWMRAQILDYALKNVPGFGMLPDNLQQTLVDDTFFNTMSYHSPTTKNMVENRLTELQLDRFGDTASGTRNAFVSGRTWVVSPSGSDCDVCGLSTNPLRTLGRAIARANAQGGDIILLRPGTYNEALTISRPSTLRATRQGSVAIGAPSAAP